VDKKTEYCTNIHGSITHKMSVIHCNTRMFNSYLPKLIYRRKILCLAVFLWVTANKLHVHINEEYL